MMITLLYTVEVESMMHMKTSIVGAFVAVGILQFVDYSLRLVIIDLCCHLVVSR